MSAPPRPAVGLVLVSHSPLVAAGTAELAGQMAPGVRIVAAGGLADGRLGTDAVRVVAAVEAADGGAGVVVLADLGSAVLAARTALELLGERAARVRLSGGPFVEGAVVAAVEASLGRDVDRVLAAAEAAAGLDKHVR